MKSFYKDNPGCLRATEALIADVNLISKMSPCAAINYIKNVMGYDSFLREEAVKQNADVSEYYDVLDFFIEMTKDCKTIKQAIDKLNIMRLKVDYENKT